MISEAILHVTRLDAIVEVFTCFHLWAMTHTKRIKKISWQMAKGVKLFPNNNVSLSVARKALKAFTTCGALDCFSWEAILGNKNNK